MSLLAAALPPIKNPTIDYHAIAPELVLAGTIFAVLILDVFLPRDRKYLSMPLAFVGTAGSLAATLTLIGSTRSTFGGSYVVDNFAVLFKVFFTSVSLVVLLLSYRYFRDGRYSQRKSYSLLRGPSLGPPALASSPDPTTLFTSPGRASAR